MLKPFFRYYGGKWRAAPRYPAPQHDTIIEPFAGAAGYSLRYPERKVILVEKYPVLAELWRYLIRVKPSEVRRIPEVHHVEDLPRWVPEGARSLVGFAMNSGTSAPCNAISAGRMKMRRMGRSLEGWTPALRGRIARQVERIRHWKVIEGDYSEAPDIPATWFIDAPYIGPAGRHYIHHVLDYRELAAWSRTRRGQVLVCENEGADWLPFNSLGTFKGVLGRDGSREVLWQSGQKLSTVHLMATKKSDALIEEFLGHISKLADNLRSAIIQEAHEAFAGLAGGAGGGGGVGNGRRSIKASPAPKQLKGKGGRNRRSPEDMEKQSNQILAFIKKNPGKRAEDIGKALGLSTAEMALPIQKMLSEGTLKKKGIKRATNYTASK